MLKKSIKMQTNLMINQTLFSATFLFILGFVVISFIANILKTNGTDIIIQMYHQTEYTFLSPLNNSSISFLTLFPFIIILPAGFSFFADKNSRIFVFIKSRVGTKNYYYGKFISVFLVTFIAVVLPLLIELLLYSLCFPSVSNGYSFETTLFDTNYISSVKLYWLSSLYITNRYLYCVVFDIFIGIVASIFATFTMAISTLNLVKFRVLLFIPTYLIFNLSGRVIQLLTGLSIETNTIFYLTKYTRQLNSFIGVYVILIVLFLISIGITIKNAYGDII